MALQINGYWRGLSWGCATAGRPSVQINLSHTPDAQTAEKNALSLSLENLINEVEYSLDKLHFIQIFSISMQQKNILQVHNPLIQREIYYFSAYALESIDNKVTIHVNNKMDISQLDPRINTVIMPVVPSMGNPEENYWYNLESLHEDGEVLFLIHTEHDYIWMKEQINRFNLSDRFIVLMRIEKQFENLDYWIREIVSDSLGIQLLHDYSSFTVCLPLENPVNSGRK